MSAKRSRAEATSGGPPAVDELLEKGYLVLADQTGNVVHVARPVIVQSARYLLGRLSAEGLEPPRRFGFTSAITGEGVSFVLKTVALVLAHDHQKEVCVVDLNWANPTVWPKSGDDELGRDLAAVIRSGTSLDRAIRPTNVPGLSYLPAGSAGPAERPMLAHSSVLDAILDDLAGRYEHVLMDLPAVQATGDSLPLAHKSDGVVLVIGAGVTTETQITRAVADLGTVPILGAVVNRQESSVPSFIRRRFAV